MTANGKRSHGVTETSAGAPASAAVAGSPYAIVPSAGGGVGTGQLHDHVRQRQTEALTGLRS